MAMEDPRVLLPINMSFNPFRSTSHHASKHPVQSDDPDNDDWHTNHSSPIHNHENNNIPSPSYRSSTALSWIQSWTTSSLSITKTTSSSSSPQQRRASSSAAIIIQDDENTHTTTHSSLSMPSVHMSPAKSMTMHRGVGTSPKSEENQRAQTIDNPEVHNNNSIPPLPLHIPPGEVSGGRKNGSDSDTTSIEGREDNTNNIDSLHDLPPYPQPRAAAPRKQTIDATPRTNKPLLEDFPSPKYNVTTEINGRRNSGSSSLVQSRNKQQIILKKEETTFPGFALYETAKAQYCQGKYSEALDTTTECLAFQKLALSAGSATATAAAQAAKEAASNSKENTPISTSVPANPNDTMMTQLDLRSTFVTGAASSMLNVVQSLKTDNSPKMMMGQHKRHPQQHPHPMLSNSIATMVSQYPTHPCVAQTLLLRGHVLATLHRYDNDDLSLLFKAVQHVEMSVAILRKLSITDEELGLPLVYLGNLKTQLGQFNDADMIFKEAVCILKNVQTNVKQSHLYAIQTEEDDEVISDCARYLKQITNEISHALYLYGKAYHSQRMHVEAFECYNQALRLLRKNSGPSVKKHKPQAKNVIRCMKSRCALEKLVSSYWDDVGVI